MHQSPTVAVSVLSSERHTTPGLPEAQAWTPRTQLLGWPPKHSWISLGQRSRNSPLTAPMPGVKQTSTKLKNTWLQTSCVLQQKKAWFWYYMWSSCWPPAQMATAAIQTLNALHCRLWWGRCRESLAESSRCQPDTRGWESRVSKRLKISNMFKQLSLLGDSLWTISSYLTLKASNHPAHFLFLLTWTSSHWPSSPFCELPG